MPHIPDAEGESPINWGWRVDADDKIDNVWLSLDSQKSETVFSKAFKKCGCRTKCAKNCSCEKLKLQCLLVGKCRRKCKLDSETS